MAKLGKSADWKDRWEAAHAAAFDLGKLYRGLVRRCGGPEAAASIAGRSRKQIERYLNGTSEPPFSVVIKLAAWVALSDRPQNERAA